MTVFGSLSSLFCEKAVVALTRPSASASSRRSRPSRARAPRSASGSIWGGSRCGAPWSGRRGRGSAQAPMACALSYLPRSCNSPVLSRRPVRRRRADELARRHESQGVRFRGGETAARAPTLTRAACCWSVVSRAAIPLVALSSCRFEAWPLSRGRDDPRKPLHSVGAGRIG